MRRRRSLIRSCARKSRHTTMSFGTWPCGRHIIAIMLPGDIIAR